MELHFQDIVAQLREEPIPDLLRIYSALEQEFLRRRITKDRSGVDLVSGYARMLVCDRLGLEPAGSNAARIDAIDPRNGDRYKVKATRDQERYPQVGRIGDVGGRMEFDFLIAVAFYPDFQVSRTAKIPRHVVQQLVHAPFKGRQLRLSDKLMDHPDVSDIGHLLG